MTFVSCALFAAAMTVACGHKTAEEVVDSTVETAVEEPACCEKAVEAATMSDAEHEAMLNAAREAGQAKCNCYKTDAASVESCIKSILTERYATYQNNEEFKAAMEEEFNSCVKAKATAAVQEKASEGVKEGAKALSNALNKKK